MNPLLTISSLLLAANLGAAADNATLISYSNGQFTLQNPHFRQSNLSYELRFELDGAAHQALDPHTSSFTEEQIAAKFMISGAEQALLEVYRSSAAAAVAAGLNETEYTIVWRELLYPAKGKSIVRGVCFHYEADDHWQALTHVDPSVSVSGVIFANFSIPLSGGETAETQQKNLFINQNGFGLILDDQRPSTVYSGPDRLCFTHPNNPARDYFELKLRVLLAENVREAVLRHALLP